MNTKSPIYPFFLSLSIIFLSSCGGSGIITSPDTDGGTRILGVNFGTKVPSLIAFSREYPATYSLSRDLFAMFPDGTHEKRLTNSPSDNDSPAFSPNGLSLAFTSNRSKTGYGNHDVYRLDTPSRISQISNSAFEFDSLTTDWGPDYIIASQINTLTGVPFDLIHIETYSPLGKWEKPIVTGNIASYDPCVSRDGSMIAFCARLDCPSENDPGCNGSLQIFILKTGETVPVQLTHFGGTPESPINARNPQFDYSGSKIVFQTNYWGDNWDIGYLYVNNGDVEPVRVTDNPFDDIEPCFDQSSLWIAFATNRNGNFEIYKTWDIHAPVAIPRPAETTVRLTNTLEDEHNPDWSANY
jgi:Tol biopolymer transport system component